MFTSSAEVFRTRQAVRDLIEVVRTHRAAMDRLAKSGVGFSVSAQGAFETGVLTRDQSLLCSDFLLAAATPDDDFNAFIASTALLISDRLQNGVCEDDLFWNWHAFHDHYKLADPPIRAALMNGFRAMHILGHVNLDGPPGDVDCLTIDRDAILPVLRANGLDYLRIAIEQDVPDHIAGRLWNQSISSGKPQIWPVKAGFRYLYERPVSLAPDTPETAALIPWT
jgi:hypothetical protein